MTAKPQTTYIIANWKMHFTPGEASIYLHKLSERIKPAHHLQIIIAPSLISIQPLALQVNRRQFKLAAQNFYWRDFGAFTGEVGISQLRGSVDYAIVGHSERRHYFHESDKDIREKVAAAIRNNITPILCIGETAEERKCGETKAVIFDQLLGGLSEVSQEDIDKVIIAYEPVWAISTNRDAQSAKPDDIAQAATQIRKQIAKVYSQPISSRLNILYGGSVSPSTAAAYLSIPDINGLLIGNSSLIADSFCDIVDIAKGIKHE